MNLTRTRYSRAGALWARIAQNVKKLTLRVNAIDFEFFVLMYPYVRIPWSLLGPKSQDIGRETRCTCSISKISLESLCTSGDFRNISTKSLILLAEAPYNFRNLDTKWCKYLFLGCKINGGDIRLCFRTYEKILLDGASIEVFDI